MKVVAYQTLEDRDNIDQIESEGPFICKRKGAWLGTGYYLWDTNFEWAIEWGQKAYTNYRKDFVIAECKIDLSNECFDLVGSVQNQLDFIEAIETMIQSNKIKNKDETIVPNIIQFLKDLKIFPYKSIRASDMRKTGDEIYYTTDRKEFMVLKQRVQICVIVKKYVVLFPFQVVYPEKYL